MFRFEADNQLLNSLLRRVKEHKLEYRHGCLLGNLKIPIGVVSVVIIPSFTGSHVVLTIPFKEIKSDTTGSFFLSKLVSTFWGTIAKQVEAVLIPRLLKRGFPRHTVTTEKATERAGDVGRIKVSIQAINAWLTSKHPRLKASITDLKFTPEGLEILGDLQT